MGFTELATAAIFLTSVGCAVPTGMSDPLAPAAPRNTGRAGVEQDLGYRLLSGPISVGASTYFEIEIVHSLHTIFLNARGQKVRSAHLASNQPGSVPIAPIGRVDPGPDFQTVSIRFDEVIRPGRYRLFVE